MSPAKRKQLLISGALLLLFVIFTFIFKWANSYCFDSSSGLHIIDVHVQECKLKGLFDGPYVAKAAHAYDKEKYKESFLIVDTMFPVVYSLLFVSLISLRKGTYHLLFIALIIIGALCDYGENFSFLYYLNHPSPGQADTVAFFTSLKSLFFPVNILIALFLFVRGLIKKP